MSKQKRKRVYDSREMKPRLSALEVRTRNFMITDGKVKRLAEHLEVESQEAFQLLMEEKGSYSEAVKRYEKKRRQSDG